MSRRNKPKNNQPNLWGMIQNVLIESIYKGQLPLAGLIVIFIILFWKYPSEELPALLHISKFNSILGWLMAIFISFTAVYITKRQRRIHSKEIKRISEEKKKLQQSLSTRKLQSSNKKRR